MQVSLEARGADVEFAPGAMVAMAVVRLPWVSVGPLGPARRGALSLEDSSTHVAPPLTFVGTVYGERVALSHWMRVAGVVPLDYPLKLSSLRHTMKWRRDLADTALPVKETGKSLFEKSAHARLFLIAGKCIDKRISKLQAHLKGIMKTQQQ